VNENNSSHNNFNADGKALDAKFWHTYNRLYSDAFRGMQEIQNVSQFEHTEIT
jgi:hypothetical protein